MSDLLLPAENMALTVALAQVERGEPASPNVAAVCIMALARLVDEAEDEPEECDRRDSDGAPCGYPIHGGKCRRGHTTVDVNEEALDTDALDDMTGGNPYGH